MLAQHFAQASLQQVRRSVVAHGGLADFGVDHGIHFLANANSLFGDDLMRAHSLDRVIAAPHLGNDGVVIVAVEPAPVADLPARFSVERRVIKNDFAFVARLELLRAHALADDGEDFTAVGASLSVAFEIGLWKLLVSRIGCLFGCTFPGSAGAFSLLLHRAIETFMVEGNTLIAGCVLHEVERHAEGVVKFERIFAGQSLAGTGARTDRFFELPQADIQRVCEPLFFSQHCF